MNLEIEMGENGTNSGKLVDLCERVSVFEIKRERIVSVLYEVVFGEGALGMGR